MKRNNTAVVRFKPGKLKGILKAVNSSHQFSGEPVSLVQAYLIWLPFSLPAAALVGHVIRHVTLELYPYYVVGRRA